MLIMFQGRIAFSEIGDRLSILNIYQIKGGVLFKIGEYDSFIEELHWSVQISTLFHGKIDYCKITFIKFYVN